VGATRGEGEARAQGAVSEGVFDFRHWVIFVALSFLTLAATIPFLLFWFSSQDWKRYPVAFLLATLILGIIFGNHQFRWFLLPFMRRPWDPAPARHVWKVAVATTFTPGVEPREMLALTLKALVALDYPHDTWVLDEGDDEQVKELCRQLGAFHFTRKGLQRYQSNGGIFASKSKHGNYNAWLNEIGFERYDILTNFDPDHVPTPDFLPSVLGFFEDPTIAYAQAPQAYYNQEASFIARGAAEETYEFYSIVQMANFGMGYPTIIGSHNSHRLRALKEIGGFAPHDADDLLMTVLYRSQGWEGVYLPDILARGLAPVDWTGYVIQQRRWARSVLDIKLRIRSKLSSKLRFSTRVISSLHGLNYLQPAVLAIASLLLLFGMLATGTAPSVIAHPDLLKISFVVGSMQLSDVYRQRFYLDWKAERGFHFRGRLLKVAKWPFILMGLMDVLRGHRFGYVVTVKTSKPFRPRLLTAAHVPVIAFIVLGWCVGLYSGRHAPVDVQLAAAVVLVGTLLLIGTDYLKYPDPFDEDLSRRKTGAESGVRGDSSLVLRPLSGIAPNDAGSRATSPGADHRPTT
jgi:cellulose synthase (UDP-forming)